MIDKLDILSGKVVVKDLYTYYFKGPGNNMDKHGHPIDENLHREDGPAVEHAIEPHCSQYRVNGELHRMDGPASYDGHDDPVYACEGDTSFDYEPEIEFTFDGVVDYKYGDWTRIKEEYRNA